MFIVGRSQFFAMAKLWAERASAQAQRQTNHIFLAGRSQLRSAPTARPDVLLANAEFRGPGKIFLRRAVSRLCRRWQPNRAALQSYRPTAFRSRAKFLLFASGHSVPGRECCHQILFRWNWRFSASSTSLNSKRFFRSPK